MGQSWHLCDEGPQAIFTRFLGLLHFKLESNLQEEKEICSFGGSESQHGIK